MLEATALLNRLERELWLVTASAGEQRGGLIATFVNAASIVPENPRVVAGIAKTHYTWQLIESSGAFTLHLLGENNLDLVWRFGMSSGRDGDKFLGLKMESTTTGRPILGGTLGWLNCRVEARLDTGDRSLYLAEVVQAGALAAGQPLTSSRMLGLATTAQRTELKRQLEADAVMDAAAIHAWRARILSSR